MSEIEWVFCVVLGILGALGIFYIVHLFAECNLPKAKPLQEPIKQKEELKDSRITNCFICECYVFTNNPVQYVWQTNYYCEKHHPKYDKAKERFGKIIYYKNQPSEIECDINGKPIKRAV